MSQPVKNQAALLRSATAFRDWIKCRGLNAQGQEVSMYTEFLAGTAAWNAYARTGVRVLLCGTVEMNVGKPSNEQF